MNSRNLSLNFRCQKKFDRSHKVTLEDNFSKHLQILAISILLKNPWYFFSKKVSDLFVYEFYSNNINNKIVIFINFMPRHKF